MTKEERYNKFRKENPDWRSISTKQEKINAAAAVRLKKRRDRVTMIIKMRFQKKMRMREIAEKLGISVQAVSSMILRHRINENTSPMKIKDVQS